LDVPAPPQPSLLSPTQFRNTFCAVSYETSAYAASVIRGFFFSRVQTSPTAPLLPSITSRFHVSGVSGSIWSLITRWLGQEGFGLSFPWPPLCCDRIFPPYETCSSRSFDPPPGPLRCQLLIFFFRRPRFQLKFAWMGPESNHCSVWPPRPLFVPSRPDTANLMQDRR